MNVTDACQPPYNTILLGEKYALPAATKASLWVSGIVLCTACIPTVILNLLLMVLIATKKSLHNNSNILIFSMAGVDLLTGCLSQPILGIYYTTLAKAGKKICSTMQPVRLTAIPLSLLSMITTFGIATERYLAIFRSFSYERFVTMKRLSYLTAFIWLSILGFVFVAIFTDVSYKPLSALLALSAILAAVSNTFVFTRIYILVRKIRRRINVENRPAWEPTSSEQNVEKDKRLILFTAIVIGTTFLFCAPFFIYRAINSVVIRNQNASYIWGSLTNALFCLKSMINPGLLCWQYPEIKAVIIKSFSKKNNLDTTASNNNSSKA